MTAYIRSLISIIQEMPISYQTVVFVYFALKAENRLNSRCYFYSQLIMNTSSLIVLLVYVACVACANFNSLAFADDSNSGNRIVGGDDATLGQFPYQVSLRDVEVKDHICGGSILTSRFILTAEHCTRHQQPKDIVAVVGAVRLTEGGIVIRLNKITAHENYTDFGNYDVSLIRTQDEIIFTDTVQPIALPTHDTGDDVRAILCGWGMLGVSYFYTDRNKFVLNCPLLSFRVYQEMGYFQLICNSLKHTPSQMRNVKNECRVMVKFMMNLFAR